LRWRRAFTTARNFTITPTSHADLVQSGLAQARQQFEKSFDRERTILAVIDAPTPELTSAATAALQRKLSGDTQHFESVQPLVPENFFGKERGCSSRGGGRRVTGQFEAAAPLIEIIAGDPSIGD